MEDVYLIFNTGLPDIVHVAVRQDAVIKAEKVQIQMHI